MIKKKILQLRSSVGFFGAENVVAELAKQLSYTNYHPIVGVLENSKDPHIELAEVAERYNLETKIFKCSGQIDLRTIIAIRNFIKQRNIDVIHSHGYKANIYILLATLFVNVNLIATCHPWIKNSPILKHYAWFDKSLLNRFDRIVAISEEVRDEVLMSGVSEKKISVIDNGIDISRFTNHFNRNELIKEFNIKPEKKVVGTIGRLSEEKGHSIFIEAAKVLLKNFPDLVFMIVGDGPLREELQANVSDSGLQDHVIFTGVSDNIPEVLAAMDIFVLPSLTEGLPMVLLEAMAAKKTIVTTEVGAIPGVITNKKNGLLVKPHDINALVEAITFLLNNKNKASEMAQTGYEKAVNKYSAKEMIKNYVEIYEQL